KVVTITIMVLLLLIPTEMVKSIIGERETLNYAATNEVGSKWAGPQQLNGPILTIPVVYEVVNADQKSEVVKYWHILPEELKIDGTIQPEKLRRGIYEVVVYKSKCSFTGKFDLNKSIDRNGLNEIRYDQAFLTLGITDLRGIKDEIVLNWNDEKLKVKPGSTLSDLIYSGVTIDLPDLSDNLQNKIDFDFALNLQGSQSMSFVPLGNTTEVNLTSNWPSPSFDGNFLPDSREVSATGFTANWKILQLNRNIPQSWVYGDQRENLNNAAFGVDLILPLDDYQKSMRSAKYSVLTIALTFLIFFLVEILNRRKIHPFQYTLVGLALILFYVLLISISEHTNFNVAYFISTVAIVSMVSLYSMSIFKLRKFTMILTTILAAIYGFLFVTLQLEDYALLMGSIGLTIILGATMYFTRKINWYQLNFESQE
ncbi:MAG: cell envelope integrity protein CreD, partial [Bacteroidetes bacterium CG_4_9_14_3_um_filter_41_19]